MTEPRRAITPSAAVARWQRDFATRLFVTDLAAVVVAVFGSQLLRFGVEDVDTSITHSVEISYALVSIMVILAWLLALDFYATRDHKIIGSGNLEYKRIVDATIRVFGLFAIGAFVLQSLVGRGYLLIALPLGVAPARQPLVVAPVVAAQASRRRVPPSCCPSWRAGEDRARGRADAARR